jgi:hypothetical protein
MLGFAATTSLDEMLDTVIPWIEQASENGTIWSTFCAGNLTARSGPGCARC